MARIEANLLSFSNFAYGLQSTGRRGDHDNFGGFGTYGGVGDMAALLNSTPSSNILILEGQDDLVACSSLLSGIVIGY